MLVRPFKLFAGATTWLAAVAFAHALAFAQTPEPRPGESAQQKQQRAPDPARQAEASPEPQRLPPDSRTQHAAEVAGATAEFVATAGSLPITNSAGRELAQIAYTAYTLEGVDPRRRPVTFAFNGGPGAASAWLHIGAMGPWRLPLAPGAARAPELQINAESWLGFTDLVFIDPVGTGFSRMVTDQPDGSRQGQRGRQGGREEGGARFFYSIGGDVESIAEFIQHWLKRNDRTASPKMIVGESYGGFRAPRIAHLLQTKHGVALNALVLVSPVLDFEGRRGGHSTLLYANLLPSLAAATMERNGIQPTRALLRDVEEQARVEHLADLMRGPRDKQAVDRIVARVVTVTGLSDEIVRRYGGRLGGGAYVRETNRPHGKIASSYDASVTGFDPDPNSANSRYEDPFTGALRAPMTTAMVELYTTKLGWRPDRPYVMQSSEAHGAWQWANSPSSPESMSDLRNVLALDGRLRVLVAHGFTDLVTPYLATERVLAQLPPFGEENRVRFAVYQGGHMFYSRDPSRAVFRNDVQQLLDEALNPGP